MTFQLENPPEPAPAPVKRCCGTCAYYEWAKGPTGRRRPTEAGKCKYKVPWPKQWPESYRVLRWGIRLEPPLQPCPSSMHQNDGYRCPCWAQKS